MFLICSTVSVPYPVFTFKEAWNVLQLGNVVWAIPTIPFQQAEGLKVFIAGMGDIQFPQSWVDFSPWWGYKYIIIQVSCVLLKDKMMENPNWSVVTISKSKNPLLNWVYSFMLCTALYFFYSLFNFISFETHSYVSFSALCFYIVSKCLVKS